ncbi:MAG: flagellar biosynthesis protein FlhF [Betaproteobacteria bacterium]|nr:flagellar biosynthesis protein FlhF [Betaproteobacteria bacterium]
MKPRKFFAANSREVLKLVRDALGPDALIVSNAKVAGGFEVIALPATSISELVGASRAEMALVAAPLRETAAARPSPAAATAEPRRRETTAAPSQAAPAAVSTSAEPAQPMIAAAPPAPPREALSEALVHNMVAELRNMRAVLEQRLSGLAWTELSRRDPAKVAALQALLTAGFSGELARRLTDPMPDGSDEVEGMKWLVAEVNRNLVTAGADNDIVERGGVYAIVGPTGVGKTTTTAKLAARGVVRHGADRVALLTTDTYRIGAHEQLRIYGRILGVTTSIVRDAQELKSTLSELRGKHMVLIDTVGMSQRDKLVTEQVHALTRSGGNVKRLLLLNATCNGDTLEDVVRCYEPASLDGCILTKIDEAQAIGASLDVIMRNRLALHFVANGQRVPEDLHTPNRQYLIHRALRAAAGGSVFGLEHEEYPLMLAPARQEPQRDAASGFAARMGGYVA